MFKPILLGVALASAAFCAQATVTEGTGVTFATSVTLVQGGNVSGGTVYPDSEDHGTGGGGYAARPVGTVGDWLAAGPTPGDPATLTLGAGVTGVSFLWGSADHYNSFTVNVVGGPSKSFGGTGEWTDGGSWQGITLDGDQTVANYITFSTNVGYIGSLEFHSPGINAIEIANVTVVPEPEAYGLALAGLSVVGFAMARRRKS